jgi:hypothetical protein
VQEKNGSRSSSASAPPSGCSRRWAFSKDPIPETCVTVYGTSELDSCVDASVDLVAATSYVVTTASYVNWRRAQGGFGGGGLVHGSSGGNEGSATPR